MFGGSLYLSILGDSGFKSLLPGFKFRDVLTLAKEVSSSSERVSIQDHLRVSRRDRVNRATLKATRASDPASTMLCSAIRSWFHRGWLWYLRL